MAEIINTLYGRPVAGWPAPSAHNSVTVNNAVRKVQFDIVGPPLWSYTFGMELNGNPASFAYKFTVADKFRILSYGLCMPHGLIFSNEGGDVPTIMRMQGNSNLAVNYFLDQVSDLHVPWAEYEVAADIYVDWSTAPTAGAGALWYSLEARLVQGSVSMVGVAAALNALTLYPIPYVKILHNLPLST